MDNTAPNKAASFEHGELDEVAHAAIAEPVRVEGRRVHDHAARKAQVGAYDIAIPGKSQKAQAPRRKLPTCVFVHGGSWQRGDKAGAFNNGIDEAFVRAGYVGVSVNYRLSPEYGGDPESLILIGHSAGAHLVMQLLADPQYLRRVGMETDVTNFVKGAVGISGVYNIVRIANTAFYGSLVTAPAFGERVDQWREASVTSALTKEGKTSPLLRTPLLLLTAEEDFHFGEDAQELDKWLTASGNDSVERKVIPKRNHFTILRDLTANDEDETMREIKQFIQRVLLRGEE